METETRGPHGHTGKTVYGDTLALTSPKQRLQYATALKCIAIACRLVGLVMLLAKLVSYWLPTPTKTHGDVEPPPGICAWFNLTGALWHGYTGKCDLGREAPSTCYFSVVSACVFEVRLFTITCDLHWSGIKEQGSSTTLRVPLVMCRSQA